MTLKKDNTTTHPITLSHVHTREIACAARVKCARCGVLCTPRSARTAVSASRLPRSSPAALARGDQPPAMQRPHVQTLRVVCCPTSSSGRIALRRSIVAELLSHGSVSCSCSRWRWPGSAMSWYLVRLAAGSPSFVAIELLTLPALQPSVGTSSTHC